MYKGERVTLRPFEEADLVNYRQWVNNEEIACLVDRVLPVTRQEHGDWYVDLLANNNAVVFAIQTISDSSYIGNVWLYNIEWRHRKAEVRILIGDENYHGKGLGTEALKLIVGFAFEKLNLNRICAYVLVPNERARKAFSDAGFYVEGVLKGDRFIDDEYLRILVSRMAKDMGKSSNPST